MVLEIRNVSKTFGATMALRDVSLSLRRGEIYCIAGQNGSGKSTLIKVLSGVHRPSEGAILLDDKDVTAWTPRDAIEAGIQVIYQDFSLFDNLSVAENVALSTLLRERRQLVGRAQMRAIAGRAIEALGVTLDLEQDVGALPVAGKQLVAIARALMSSPRVLIMDEPTTALTGKEVEVLFKVVREIRARGMTVVFVSHKMREMLEISDRLTILRNGEVVAAGDVGQFNESTITRAMTGLDQQFERYRPPPRQNAAPRLEVRDLSLEGHLDRINLTLMPGEIVGVSGLLGAGRTELALALFGMRPEHRGSILIDGEPVELSNVQSAIRHGVGYVAEDRLSDGLFFGQDIRQNILATMIGISGRLRLQWPALSADAEKMRQDMRISATGERLVEQLSGGNQQRVVLGRWLLTQPRILVLNGPTVGVDIGAKAEIHRVIRQMAVEKGISVLMISDDVPELLENCNRMVIMHGGRLVEAFETGSFREEDISVRLRALT